MGDLAEIVARDNFYTNLLKESDIALAKGERGLFYRTYNEALKNLPFNEISKPLKLTTRLSDNVYTSPLDGMFTTKSWAEAIKMGDAFDTNGIYKSLAYRSLMLLPKGISQAAKTILGPFTHIRNFFSAVFTTVHSGNILISPTEFKAWVNSIFLNYSWLDAPNTKFVIYTWRLIASAFMLFMGIKAAAGILSFLPFGGRRWF